MQRKRKVARGKVLQRVLTAEVCQRIRASYIYTICLRESDGEFGPKSRGFSLPAHRAVQPILFRLTDNAPLRPVIASGI